MSKSDAQTAGTPLDPTEIYERFRTPVMRFGLQRLRNRADAEDLAQETLKRVVEAVNEDRIEEPDAIAGFVYKTAQHVYFKSLRKRGTEQRALSRYSNPGQEISDDQPMTTLLQDERRDRVRTAIDALEADDRNLLQYLYGQGMKPREVARVMGMTPGAVRVRKHRALKRLGALLEDETFWPFAELDQ